jgi:hypothetical protein
MKVRQPQGGPSGGRRPPDQAPPNNPMKLPANRAKGRCGRGAASRHHAPFGARLQLIGVVMHVAGSW